MEEWQTEIVINYMKQLTKQTNKEVLELKLKCSTSHGLKINDSFNIYICTRYLIKYIDNIIYERVL